MRTHRSRSRRGALLLSLLAIGCGGGDSGSPNPPSAPPPSTPVLATLTLDATAVALKTSQTRQVQVTTLDQNAQPIVAAVTWSSSASTIATVSSSGLITAAAPGAAVVTATATAGSVSRSSVVAVTVTAPGVTSVSVTPPTLALSVGGTGTLTAAVVADAGIAGTVSWTTSTPSVAVASAVGVVTAVGPGTAQVCAISTVDTSKQGCSAVTVTAVPVATVSVSPASIPLVPGETSQFSATTRDAGGATLSGRAVAWSSSNAAVATVSQTGLVTAVGAGTTTISATSEGRSGTATVTVTTTAATVTQVTVTPASASLTVGQPVQFTATVSGTGNPPTGVTWASADATRVTVNQGGLATAVAQTSGTQVCATSILDATKKGCGSVVVIVPASFPSTATVTMPGNTFSPAQVDIAVAGTVTFTFGPATHNVQFDTATGAPANVPNTSNANVSRQFNTVGTFNYQCSLHSGMTATVVVH